jgi:hypothetical protein
VVALKVRAADDAGITPLLCVGEEATGPASGTNGGSGDLGSVSDAEPGSASATESAAAFVYGQIRAAVGGDWDLASRLVIAYEPVWAIGAAEPAGAEYVTAVVRSLRTLLAGHRLESGGTLRDLPIIYGGSAKPGLLPTLDEVSGLFLGRFAHDAANFGKVLDEALALSEALDSRGSPGSPGEAAENRRGPLREMPRGRSLRSAPVRRPRWRPGGSAAVRAASSPR